MFLAIACFFCRTDTFFLPTQTQQEPNDSSFIARPTRLFQMGRPKAPAHDTFDQESGTTTTTLFVFLAWSPR
jgi:hypothetical protein